MNDTHFVFSKNTFLINDFVVADVGVRLDRVRGGRQKYKRRPEVENATYQSAPLPLTKESEKGGSYGLVKHLFLYRSAAIIL